jgi:hypothetical protein
LLPKKGPSLYKDIAFSLEKDKKNLADAPNYSILASYYLILANFAAKSVKKASSKRG